MSKIKNYTTQISASKSISEISDCLVDVGADNISYQIEQETKITKSITFTIPHSGNSIPYRINANSDGAYSYLLSEKKRINKEVEKKCKEQSYKVAWRIVRDWVLAQAALIKLEQATPMQLFLSYAFDMNQNKSVYEKVIDGELKLLK